MGEVMWTRSNGQKVPISEMGDFHLLAAIAMMRRNGYVSTSDWSLWMSDPGPRGDMAQESLSHKEDPMLDKKPSTLLDGLDTEARRRGLIR